MEEFALDAMDLHLLAQLQEDASLSNQTLAERVNTSAPTCLRRVKRLVNAGLIERQIAILNPEKMAATLGYGLTAIVEITLDRQDAQALDRFETKVADIPEVQQCYRLSPGPDFCLVVHAAHMPGYQALAQRHDWAARAVAYDREWELQRSAATGLTPERDTVANLTQVVQLEVRKLLKQSAQTEGNVMTVKEIASVMTTIQGFHEEARKSESARRDLSKLSKDKLKKVLEAQAILKELDEAK